MTSRNTRVAALAASGAVLLGFGLATVVASDAHAGRLQTSTSTLTVKPVQPTQSIPPYHADGRL